MRSHFIRGVIPLAGCLAVLSAGCIHTPAVSPRPDTWAQPIHAEELPNLHRVSDDLYRSAQPTGEAYAEAHQMGIKTVVNLRPGKGAARSERERDPMVINIPVKTGAPRYEDARRFFEIVDDPARQPVLLHCYHGADRTGAFTALYRINRQGWSAEHAITEMTGGGYKFHSMWIDLADWVRNAPKF